jgi:hypothetical protein
LVRATNCRPAGITWHTTSCNGTARGDAFSRPGRIRQRFGVSGCRLADAITTRFANTRQIALRPTSAVLPFNDTQSDPARVAASLGDADESLMWLERAADTGFPCYPWFERDSLLDPVRHHAAFVRLLGRLRDAHERARRRAQ